MGGVFLKQKQQLALKLEAVEGTDAAPGAPDVVAPIFDAEYTPAFTMQERPTVDPSLSRVASVAGERSASIRFSLEVKGSGAAGTAPPGLGAALKACGFSETVVPATSVTYKPGSGQASATLVLKEGHHDGTTKDRKIIGAMGTVRFEAKKGDRVMAMFEFTGRYVEPTEGTFLTHPSMAPLPPVVLAASLSFLGVGTLRVQNITIDLANEVSLRNDVNEASGNFSAVVTARNPVGSIDPEREKLATFNSFNKLTSETLGILTFLATRGAGNKVTFNCPKAQITNLAEGDRDGISIETLDLKFSRDTDTGDDEMNLVFE